MKFNKGQKEAIETIDKNVCVIAGAGTGKTAILTHRFINIIKSSKLPLEKALTSTLAITFTKKATQEMINRITNEIIKISESDKRFKDLLNYIPFINVSTIDAFCKKIIDENNLYIGLGSDYEIIESVEGNKILNSVILDVLNKKIKEDNLLKNFMLESGYPRIGELVNKLNSAYRKIISKGYDFDELIDKFPKLDREPDFGKLKDYLDKKLSYFINEKYIDGRNKITKLYNNGFLENLCDDNTNKKELLNEIINNINTSKRIPDKEKEEITEKIIEEKVLLEKDNEKYYILINDILKEIEREFRVRKLNESKLEFNDLLYYTKKILENKEIRKFYQEEFQYIMIDEFQDTNYTQRDIFYSLSSDEALLDRNNFFVVGDPKQSIYGFRGSDLSVFEKTIEDIKKSKGKIINLETNYRSSEEIVNYTNILFGNIMEEKYQPLEYFQDYENKKIKHIKINDVEDNEGDIVSRTIKKLVEGEYTYRDIGVLFRSTTNLKELEESLNKYNIPYINPKSKEFFNKREIKDLILFVKVLNSPEDSLSLYGLLRSNIFSIDDERLYELGKNKNQNLWNNLKDYDGNDEEILKAKEILEKILSKKSQTNIYDLITEFIKETKVYEIYSLYSGNQQILENIQKFEELALEYSGKYNNYPNEFLEFLKDKKLNDEREASVELSENFINLSTIHGAKGLEYPVIIFYDSKNSPNYMTEDIEVNGEFGYGLRLDGDSEIYKKVKLENKNLDLEERDRLLYVCVTRAEQEFIFIDFEGGRKRKLTEDSFLYKLLETEMYEYEIIDEVSVKQNLEDKKIKITSDHSKILKDEKIKFPKKDVISSITGYNLFKKCPREYFYKYKLGIKDIEVLDKEYDETNFPSEESKSVIDPGEYGTMIHSFLENYDNLDIENEISKVIKNLDLEDRDFLENRIRKHINSYKNRKTDRNSIFEFEFLLKLESGMMTGSIDKLIISDEEIEIVDFKTNRIKNLDQLINYYTPQIRLYGMAVKELFGKTPKKSYIHFLEEDILEEIKWNDEENKKLLNDLNYFLRFICLNDSIDKYKYTENCDEFCNYKNLCYEERNE